MTSPTNVVENSGMMNSSDNIPDCVPILTGFTGFKAKQKNPKLYLSIYKTEWLKPQSLGVQHIATLPPSLLGCRYQDLLTVDEFVLVWTTPGRL